MRANPSITPVLLWSAAFRQFRFTQPGLASRKQYLWGGLGEHRLQSRLWKTRAEGKLVLLDIMPHEADRMGILMRQYSDRPMDLADASLVAVAESRDYRRVFTLDSDFYFYKLANGSTLEVVR